MNRHVEQMQKNVKYLIGLFIALGILFLSLLILFIISTSKYFFTVVFGFLLFSIFFFLMAFFFNGFIKRLVRNNGWIKSNRFNKVLFYGSICVIIGECFLICANLMVHWYFGKEVVFSNLIVLRGSRMVVWCFMFVLSRNLMKLYDGYETKSFPGWSEKGLEFLTETFKENSVPINPIGEKKEGFLLKFNERFELPNGILLRFRIPKKVDSKIGIFNPEAGFSFTVEVGPRRKENKEYIRKIKAIVDVLDEQFESQ